VRIGLYIEHGVGGAELAMAYLASAWSRQHEVDLVHHRPPLTKERLAAFTYDVFVNCTHWLPCFNYATTGILFVLFPIYVRPEHTPEIQRLAAWKRLRHAAYFGTEWRRRLDTYQHRTTISAFSRAWTKTRWNIDSDVVYPPVAVDFATAAKRDLVLSVGRFSTIAHTKKQLEMVAAFRELERDGADGWGYTCIGGLNARQENHDYFARVKAAADGCPSVCVGANVRHAQVRGLFEHAKIF
jgi:hypothetical protein